MEVTKLQQALDEIIVKCKDAGHKLHVFKTEDIQVESIVGRGEEGIVQLCRVKYHGLEEPAAMKTITTNGGKEMLEFLLKELEMVVLGSDSIVNTVLKVYGVTLIPVNLNTRSQNVAYCHLGIIMERGICNLLELCLREEMSLQLRLRVMTQLARAIHHLHSGDPHILHRDIKPQNFVVVEAEVSERTGIVRNVKIKVIDLGMALVVNDVAEPVTGVVGTWGFHAPEMWDEKTYDAKADIFSLAITFLVVLLEKPTVKIVDDIMDQLHELKIKGVLGEKLINGVREHFIKEDIPKQLEDLLIRMLSCEKKRPADIGAIYNLLNNIVDNQRRSSSASSSSSSSSSSNFPFATPTTTTTSRRKVSSDRGIESDSDYSSLHSNSSRGSRGSRGRELIAASAVAAIADAVALPGSVSPTPIHPSPAAPLPFPPMSPMTPMSPPLIIHPSSSSMHPLAMSSSATAAATPPVKKLHLNTSAAATAALDITASPRQKPALPTSPPTPGFVSVEEFNSLMEKYREQTMSLTFKEQLLQQKDSVIQQQKKEVKKMENDNRMLLKKLSLNKDQDEPMKMRFGVKRPLFRQPSGPSSIPESEKLERKRTRSTPDGSPVSLTAESRVEALLTRKRRKTSEEKAETEAETTLKAETAEAEAVPSESVGVSRDDATANSSTNAGGKEHGATPPPTIPRDDDTPRRNSTQRDASTPHDDNNTPRCTTPRNNNSTRRDATPHHDATTFRAARPTKRSSDKRREEENESTTPPSRPSTRSSQDEEPTTPTAPAQTRASSMQTKKDGDSTTTTPTRASTTRNESTTMQTKPTRSMRKDVVEESSTTTTTTTTTTSMITSASLPLNKAGEMKQGSRKISAERISKLKLALKNAEQREERSSGRMKSIAATAATAAATPHSPSSPAVPGAVRAKAPVDKRCADDSDDDDEEEKEETTLRVTTRNQKSFWQDKVTRSRLQEDVSLKGMWDGFHSLKRFTSISKWFGK